MTGKRKAPSGSSTLPGQKAKGPRQETGAESPLPERRSLLHGSAFLIVCFACFLLGFRLSWEGKAAFLGAYRIGPESGKLVLRDTLIGLDSADSEERGGAKQGGLDLRPGAWESGQGDKYGAGVADGEWERIETRILASAGGSTNASETSRSRRLLPRPPPSPSKHPWVGRHNISVRPWPHPDAGETLLAHALIAAVQVLARSLEGYPVACFLSSVLCILRDVVTLRKDVDTRAYGILADRKPSDQSVASVSSFLNSRSSARDLGQLAAGLWCSSFVRCV